MVPDTTTTNIKAKGQTMTLAFHGMKALAILS
jgi:hypothetical protein